MWVTEHPSDALPGVLLTGTILSLLLAVMKTANKKFEENSQLENKKFTISSLVSIIEIRP